MSARIVVAAALLPALLAGPGRAEPSGCQGTIVEGRESCAFTYTGPRMRVFGAVAGASQAHMGSIPAADVPWIDVKIWATIDGSIQAVVRCGGPVCQASSPRLLTPGTPLECSATLRYVPFSPDPPQAAAGAFACFAGT